ncbi:MAG: hypothetical protein NTZ20_05525 [Candidatus Levybacteria bacterium]|nr:hypothetical protein [Candidatus Levybacteria bacterium]
MVEIRSQPINLNFLHSTGFRFFVKKLPMTNFFTESINIPGKKITYTTQPTPNHDIPLWGNKLIYNDLTVTFMVDEDLKNYMEISDWLDGIGKPESFDQRKLLVKKERIFEGIRSDCIISVTTNTKNPNIVFTIKDAFPTSISDLIFSTSQSSEEHLAATATFKFAGITMERRSNEI